MKIPIIKNQTKTYSALDPIELLELPKPIEYALKKSKVTTVGKFYKSRRKRLYKIKHLGRKSVSYLMKIKKTITISNQLSQGNELQSLPKQKNVYINQVPLTYSIFDNISLPAFVKRNDPLSVLSLPTRLENSLRNYEIDTIGKFLDYDEGDLFKIRNVGHKASTYLSEIKRRLKDTDDVNKVESKQTEYLQFILNGSILTGEESVSLLDFPVRLENALTSGGIDTIKKFYESSSKDLFKLRNLGPKSVKLFESKKNSMDTFSKTRQEEVKIKIDQQKRDQNQPEISKELLIDMLIGRTRDSRAEEIIKKRYGLANGEKTTLEEIGQDYGVSRERIRQLQVKAIKKLRHPSVLEKELILEMVHEMLWNYDGLINAEEADNSLPKFFNNFPYDGSSVLDLLADLEWIDTHDVGDIQFYSPLLTNMRLSSLINDTLDILKKDKTLLSAESLANKFPSVQLERDKLTKLILRICKLDPRVEEGARGEFTSYLVNGSRKNVWVSFMVQALEEEGFPMHFTEIANKVNDLLRPKGKYLEQKRIHSMLIEAPVFALTGARGMYGLTKWGIRKESTIDLSKEYIKKAGFPVHWEQIYLYVSKYKDTKKMNIRMLLDTSGKFIKKGNGFYWINS